MWSTQTAGIFFLKTTTWEKTGWNPNPNPWSRKAEIPDPKPSVTFNGSLRRHQVLFSVWFFVHFCHMLLPFIVFRQPVVHFLWTFRLLLIDFGKFCHVWLTVCSLFVNTLFNFCRLFVHFCQRFVYFLLVACPIFVKYLFTVCSIFVIFSFIFCQLFVHLLSDPLEELKKQETG